MRETHVTMDDDSFPLIPAWTDESDWNGWAKPHFPFDAAVAVGLHIIESGMGIAAYDPGTREFHFALLDRGCEKPYDIDLMEVAAGDVSAGVFPVLVRQIDKRLETYAAELISDAYPPTWQIGDGWCWMEVDNDNTI